MKYRVRDRHIFIISALVALAWVGASVALKLLSTGLPVRLLIGLLPVILLVFQIILAYRYSLGQDEVMRKINLEGLSTAFIIGLPVIFLIGFMMQAGISLPLSFMDGGYILEVAFLIGYVIAYRRYQ